MKTTAINFEQKECNECGNQLSLPTIHFTCGHVFHEFCIDSEGIRKCTKCEGSFAYVLETKEAFKEQSSNTEQFFKELNAAPVKFNTIATYFGMDLFADLDSRLPPIEEQ
jgi:hypothetical protein